MQAGVFLPTPWLSFQWIRHRNSNRPTHSPIPTECCEKIWVYPTTREMETWELNRLASLAELKTWMGRLHRASWSRLPALEASRARLCSWNIHRTEELGFLICFLLLWQRTTKNNLGRRLFISVFTGRKVFISVFTGRRVFISVFTGCYQGKLRQEHNHNRNTESGTKAESTKSPACWLAPHGWLDKLSYTIRTICPHQSGPAHINH